MSQLSIFDEPLPDFLLGLEEESSRISALSKNDTRYYQDDAVDAVKKSLAENTSALVVMATGLGKTQVAGALTRGTRGRVLFIAHRSELIDQAAKRMEAMCEEHVEIEQASLYADKGRIVIASVQTLSRGDRFKKWLANAFELVIVDEAHHYTAKTYRKPIDYFRSGGAKIVGLTATPDRSDEEALGQIFDDVAFLMDVQEGIEQGFLVPVRAKQIYIEELDISEVDTSGGDLVAGQLDKALIKAVESVVQATLREEPDRTCIGFFPGVASAEFAAQRFNALRSGSAIVISDKTPRDERKMLVDDFRKGRYQYLLNCMIATEGFDAPLADCVLLGRPTKSRSLMAQMIGRGTRPAANAGLEAHSAREDAAARRALIAASKKPDLMVLDFQGNVGKHRLSCPLDVLGGNFSEAEIATAKKLAEKAPGADQMALLGDAREQLRRAREAMENAAKLLRSKVKHRAEAIDVFAFFELDEGRESALNSRYGYKPMTQNQFTALRKAGFTEDELESMSRHTASKVFGEMTRRRELGLCTFKQARTIRPHIAVPDNLSFHRASQTIDYIQASKWRRDKPFDPKVLDDIVNGQRQPGEEG